MLNLPKRPATFIHHSGKQIQILANHFNFKIEHSVIYQYTVSIEVQIDFIFFGFIYSLINLLLAFS